MDRQMKVWTDDRQMWIYEWTDGQTAAGARLENAGGAPCTERLGHGGRALRGTSRTVGRRPSFPGQLHTYSLLPSTVVPAPPKQAHCTVLLKDQ